MDVWHLTLGTNGRLPLFPTEAARRSAVRALARVAGPATILFCLVDEHIHVVLAGQRQKAGRLAGAIRQAIRRLSAAPTEPAHIRAVESRAHMERLASYLLEQPARHGLPEHPALWSGSCFVDLVGARVLPGYGLPVQVVLPRFRLSTAFAAVGLGSTQLSPYDDEEILAAGTGRLAAAVTAATALGPQLKGNSAPVVEARTAAAVLGVSAGLGTRQMARALGLTRRAVQRLARGPAALPILRAVRIRLALEDLVARSRFVPTHPVPH